MASKTTERTAVIAIGRWEPPHRGHEVLIRDTVQRAIDEEGDPFVWTSPTDDTDPLSVAQKIYYLQRMYPKRLYSDLTFLTDYPALGLSAAYKKELKTGRCQMTTRGAEKRLPKNWAGMDICQKYKYKNIVNDKLLSRVRLVRDRAARVSPGDTKLPSKQCLNWLKSDAGGNYTRVILLVGSDRVEAFTRYNQKLGEGLFTKFSIEQSGAERGATGRQELSEYVSNLNSDAELEKLSKLMSELSFEEREGSSKVSLAEREKEFRAEEYSGTKTRQYARDGIGELFMHAVYLDSSDMTYLDCFCMMNDIRVGSNMDAIPLREWSRDIVPLIPQQKKILETQVNSIDDWERSTTIANDDDDNDEKYMKQFAHIGPKSRRRRKKRRGGRKTRRKKKKKKKTRRKKRKIKTRRKKRKTRKN